MISPLLVDNVRALLAQPGYSQRRIAALTGVSRASVGAIASGRRPDYPARRDPEDEFDALESGPAVRCPTCGGRVFLPCRLCRVRAIKQRDRERRRAAARERQFSNPARTTSSGSV